VTPADQLLLHRLIKQHGYAPAHALDAVLLRSGVSMERIQAADVVLATAVDDALTEIRAGYPVSARMTLTAAAEQADRLLKAPA